MDFAGYWAAWDERFERQCRVTRSEAQRAARQAELLASILVERYGATRVVLVGSLVRGDFGPDSDIDLAAAGIAPTAFFAAGADLERESGGFKVDLVPLESANSFFLEQVAQQGVVLR